VVEHDFVVLLFCLLNDDISLHFIVSFITEKKKKNEQLNTKHLAIIHPQQTTLMIRYS